VFPLKITPEQKFTGSIQPFSSLPRRQPRKGDPQIPLMANFSTVAERKSNYPFWVNIESAGWGNIRPT